MCQVHSFGRARTNEGRDQALELESDQTAVLRNLAGVRPKPEPRTPGPKTRTTSPAKPKKRPANRNTKHETRITKYETRNTKLETRNQRSETRNPRPETPTSQACKCAWATTRPPPPLLQPLLWGSRTPCKAVATPYKRVTPAMLGNSFYKEPRRRAHAVG